MLVRGSARLLCLHKFTWRTDRSRDSLADSPSTTIPSALQ